MIPQSRHRLEFHYDTCLVSRLLGCAMTSADAEDTEMACTNIKRREFIARVRKLEL